MISPASPSLEVILVCMVSSSAPCPVGVVSLSAPCPCPHPSHSIQALVARSVCGPCAMQPRWRYATVVWSGTASEPCVSYESQSEHEQQHQHESESHREAAAGHPP